MRPVEIYDFCRKPKGLAKAITLKVKPRGRPQKGAAHKDLSSIPTHKAHQTYRQLMTNFSTGSYVEGKDVTPMADTCRAILARPPQSHIKM